MLDPNAIPPVAAEELLARYILSRSRIRQDLTVKPDAFMPHPYRELSVTRHRESSDEEVWAAGQRVASQRHLPLFGRADLLAGACTDQKLSVVPDPLDDNPNHANVSDWPADKAAQKLIAAELAASCIFRPR